MVALWGGCASSVPKPVGVDRVPPRKPQESQAVAFINLYELNALGRIQEDAKQFLWPVDERVEVCQYAPQAISVVLFSPDESGNRYLTAVYNPEACPIPETYPLLHRHLAYVLAPNGELFGSRVLGR